jgi:choline dehydrogenase
LAARLSEDPETHVLVLEAGPPDDADEIRMPAATPMLWQGPFAWQDATTAQVKAAGRSIFWPHGRTLGGSSSINGMVYIRGSRRDYDGWQESYGCAGWCYADLLPYFRRAEDQQHGVSAYHGVGGPLRVESPRYVHPISEAWVTAATAAGFTYNEDFNGAGQDGVGLYQTTARSGQRWSTADAYLRPAMKRRNVTVETDALATQVLVENGRATGLRYRSGGADHVARARREVLLSAGAIDSPQLLMLSGIGPSEQLQEHGIKPLIDSPKVGRGLQNHPTCFLVWRTPTTASLAQEATPDNIGRWMRDREGPMASQGIEAGGFARSHFGLPAPDLQFGIAAGPPPLPELGESSQRLTIMIIVAVDVQSRGQVSLRSADPRVRPLIDPGYLAKEVDLDVLIAGIHYARQIATQPPLAQLVDGEYAPGEAVDDLDLRRWVSRNVTTIFHPTSSCAMGGGQDSVCDSQLRVRGLARLRVVDASVMPTVPRGNTNAPTIALAERASM